MGALGILLEDAAIRRTNRHHHRTAMRQMGEITAAAKRDMTNVARHADRIERRKAAATELPAGRAARLIHRTGQVNELVGQAASILVGVAAVLAALRELRQPDTREQQ